jgi:hypothetical protein
MKYSLRFEPWLTFGSPVHFESWTSDSNYEAGEGTSFRIFPVRLAVVIPMIAVGGFQLSSELLSALSSTTAVRIIRADKYRIFSLAIQLEIWFSVLFDCRCEVIDCRNESVYVLVQHELIKFNSIFPLSCLFQWHYLISSGLQTLVANQVRSRGGRDTEALRSQLWLRRLGRIGASFSFRNVQQCRD